MYSNGVVSTLYIVFKIKDLDKIDSDYLVSYFETNGWHKSIQAIAAEGARNHGLLNILAPDFFATKHWMPNLKCEQIKIGKLISEVNSLITLHQRKRYLSIKAGN